MALLVDTNAVNAKREKSSLSDRGKPAEDSLHAAMRAWVAGSPSTRDVTKLLDSYAVGVTVRMAVSDFEIDAVVNGVGVHAYIEVKQTEHPYRLAKTKFGQRAKLLHKTKCGAQAFLVVMHTPTGKKPYWRVLPVGMSLAVEDKGSWDMRDVESYPSATEAFSTLVTFLEAYTCAVQTPP